MASEDPFHDRNDASDGGLMSTSHSMLSDSNASVVGDASHHVGKGVWLPSAMASFAGGLGIMLEEGEDLSRHMKWVSSCGRCPPCVANEGSVLHPRADLFADLAKSSRRLVIPGNDAGPPVVSRSSSSSSGFSDSRDLPASWDDLHLDSLDLSRFSQLPHPQFPHFAVHDVTRLAMRLTQERVRVPMLGELNSESQAQREALRQNRENLELSTLRSAAKRSAKRRSPAELRMLFRYLKNLEFFCDLSPAIMADVVCSVKLKKFAKGSIICERHAPVTGVHTILRGEVAIEEVNKDGSGSDSSPSQVKFAADPAPQSLSSLGKHQGMRAGKILSKKKVMGPVELFAESVRVYSCEENPVYPRRAIAKTAVEVLFLPRDDIVPRLLAEAREEKMTALRELFPMTRGKQEKDLTAPSRVERGGTKLKLLDLFNLQGMRKGTVLYIQGERQTLDAGQLYFIVQGSVTMKLRGAVIEELSVGTLVGDAVLRREPHAYTCAVKSDTLLALTISAADYLVQFPGRNNTRSDLSEANPRAFERRHGRVLDKIALGQVAGDLAGKGKLAGERQALGARADGSVAQSHEGATDEHSIATDYLRQLQHSLKGAAKRREDAEALMATEWRLLRHRTLPRRVAPEGSPSRSGLNDSVRSSGTAHDSSRAQSARSRMLSSVLDA
mmetsp:Transcript_55167/g.129156  ORF Transcript_55167/g.129156 Transcript_55167/m.129156 type:complete len:670 (+) Transcript_55167:150-2159(+)